MMIMVEGGGGSDGGCGGGNDNGDGGGRWLWWVEVSMEVMMATMTVWRVVVVVMLEGRGVTWW